MAKNKRKNPHKKFVRGILASIILYLIFLFSITSCYSKMISNEKINLVNNISETETLIKEDSNSELEEKKKVEEKVEEKNAESSTTKEEKDKNVELPVIKEKKEGVEYKVKEGKTINITVRKSTFKNFLKNSGVKVYEDTTKKKVINTLEKGTKITVIEEADVERVKITKVKNKDGKTVNKEVTSIEKMEKISYKRSNKEYKGWIIKDQYTDNLVDTLPDSWSTLNFNKIKKNEYKDNKRIKTRGIYVTGVVASIPSRLDDLIKFSKENDINAFVIDVKGDRGEILFKMDSLKDLPWEKSITVFSKDIDSIMKKLKENNIYAIARIVSFKDPTYAKHNPTKTILNKNTNKPHTDKDKVIWVSPHDRDLWEYNVKIAKEAAKAGFNEIQFDYVRFPASNGGKLDKNLNYRNTKKESKPKAIQELLEYAREELSPLNVYISADVYGQVGSTSDDMGLGQYWEAISNVVDYISPMMYPSHYGKNVYGIPVPDANPYKTIYHSTKDSINRSHNIEDPALIKPWIQAFTATWVKGHLKYGKKELNDQIKALKDLGIEEYILWSPTNKYKSFY